MLPFLDAWRELINCGNEVIQSVQPSPVQKHRILEIPLTTIPRNSPPPKQKAFKARSSPISIPLTNIDKKFDTNKPNTPSSTSSFTFPSPVPQTTPSKAKCVVVIHADISTQSNPSTKTIETSKKNVECISHISPSSSPTTPKSQTPILAIPQKYETFQKSTQFEQREVSLTPPVPNNSPTTNT